MKIYSKEEMLNELKKDDKLVVYVGYFIDVRNSVGHVVGARETLENGMCMAQGYNFAKTVNFSKDYKFYKVKNGFATEYIYNLMKHEQ